jgi:hypothetical protein
LAGALVAAGWGADVGFAALLVVGAAALAVVGVAALTLGAAVGLGAAVAGGGEAGEHAATTVPAKARSESSRTFRRGNRDNESTITLLQMFSRP